MSAEIVFRRAEKEEAYAVWQMMTEVHEQMEQKELFVCDDLPWVEKHMEEEGFAVVACTAAGTFAGCLIVGFPGISEENLGCDIGLPEEELLAVAHMESAVVRSKFRGQHLQRRLLQYAEASLDKRKYYHLLATISPENPASYKSVEACGYRCVLTKEKYNGLLRRIYYKDSIENID